MLRPVTTFVKAAAFAAISTASVFAISPAVVDDCNDGNSENNFGAYWYVYDDLNKSVYLNGNYEAGVLIDSLGGGNSEGWTNITKSTRIPGEYNSFYMTTPDRSGTGKCFRGEYSFGDIGAYWGIGATDYSYPMVAVGTGLITEGKNLDLTGVKKITYWARANTATILSVQLATNQFDTLAPAYHEISQAITTDWAQYEINLDSLKQPEWVIGADGEKIAIINKEFARATGRDTNGINLVYAFDPAQCSKLQWEVAVEKNPTFSLKTGWIELDDIVVENYNWLPEDYSYNGDTGIHVEADSDCVVEANLTEAWYAYNDAQGRDLVKYPNYSAATSGATPGTQTHLLDLQPGTYNGVPAVYIGYTLGDTFHFLNPDSLALEDTLNLKPFMGIGVELIDTPSMPAFDAAAKNLTGVYFEYSTSFDENHFLRFEVEDSVNVYNAARARHGVELEGGAHSISLPGTNGAWKSINVHFTHMTLPSWDIIIDPKRKLDPTCLVRMQWAREGQMAEAGSFGIKKVMIVEDPSPDAILSQPASNRATQFSARVAGNSILFTLGAQMHGTVELMNLSGKVLARVDAQRATSIPLAGIANGSYVVRLNTVGTTLSTPLSIVR